MFLACGKKTLYTTGDRGILKKIRIRMFLRMRHSLRIVVIRFHAHNSI